VGPIVGREEDGEYEALRPWDQREIGGSYFSLLGSTSG
jgi:hypothetical protein